MIETLKKSLQLDGSLLGIRYLSFGQRLRFIWQKYAAVIRIKLLGRAHLDVGLARFTFTDPISMGTLQSSIVDFYDDIAAPQMLSGSRPIIVDVGANIGQFCSAAKLFFPKSSVYSFEPDPEVFEQLEANLQGAKGVELFNIGLGEKREKLPFYVHNLSVMSSFKQYDGHDYTDSDTKYLEIRSLDKVLSKVPHIQLLKIDVEGFEMQVLRGGVKTLQRTDYLLIEISMGREQAEDNNLGLLRLVHELCPQAKIVKFGRPLGNPKRPACQDILIRLNPPTKRRKQRAA